MWYEKFRIRNYNSDNSVIKFESKQRANSAINKTSKILSITETKNIINGNYKDFLSHNDNFTDIIINFLGLIVFVFF